MTLMIYTPVTTDTHITFSLWLLPQSQYFHCDLSNSQSIINGATDTQIIHSLWPILTQITHCGLWNSQDTFTMSFDYHILSSLGVCHWQNTFLWPLALTLFPHLSSDTDSIPSLWALMLIKCPQLPLNLTKYSYYDICHSYNILIVTIGIHIMPLVVTDTHIVS